MLRLLPKPRFWWDSRAWSVPNKNDTPNVDACAVNSLPKIKLFFFKVRFLKFILQILSSDFYLRVSFAKLLNFKLSKICCKIPKLNKRILSHFEKWVWRVGFELFWKESVLPRKMGQNERFSNLNLQILSSNFNLRDCFVRLFNFNVSSPHFESENSISWKRLGIFISLYLACRRKRSFLPFWRGKTIFCKKHWKSTRQTHFFKMSFT